MSGTQPHKLPVFPPEDDDEIRRLKDRLKARACGVALDDYTPRLDPTGLYTEEGSLG